MKMLIILLIKDKKMINIILTILADEELRDIFNIMKEKPVSAQEILKNTKIPHTSFYRKINWMLENKLVIIDSVQETKDNKKYSMFRAIFDDITIKLQRDIITIEATPTVDLAEIIANEFFEM
jgi:DNA-binding transcriptional ArsR family regulator